MNKKLKIGTWILIKAGSKIEFDDCVCDGGVIRREGILLTNASMFVEAVEIEEGKMIKADTKNIYREMLKK